MEKIALLVEGAARHGIRVKVAIPAQNQSAIEKTVVSH